MLQLKRECRNSRIHLKPVSIVTTFSDDRRARTDGGSNIVDRVNIPLLLPRRSKRQLREHIRRDERLEMGLKHDPSRLRFDTGGTI